MTPALPPPSAEELAAIRARVDGRRGRLHRRARGVALRLLVAVLPVLLLAGLAVLLVAEWRWAFDERWKVVYVVTLVPPVVWTSTRAVLRTDAAVAARLDSRGRPGLAASTRLGTVEVAALALVGGVMALAVSFRADDAARARTPVSVAALAVVLLAVAALAGILARLLGGAAALLLLRSHRAGDAALLADPRLVTAEPPRSWLARGGTLT